MPECAQFRATIPVLDALLRRFLDTRSVELRPLGIAFAVILALSLGAAWPSRASESPGELLKSQFDAAKASLAANNLAQAESRYRATIALGLRQLASLSLSEGQSEQAITYLNDAIKLHPDDFPLRIGLAVAWFREGDQKKAAELISAALASRPNDPQAHNLMGRLFLLQNDFPRAIQELTTALNLHYDFQTAYFLGLAYLEVKKLPQARELFEQLESNAEESAALHVIFGRAYLMANYPKQAITEFKIAIKLNPNYPHEHGLLGYAYLDYLGEEEYPHARKEFEEELKINPNQFYFQTLLGIATVALRDFPAAEIALRKAVQLRPGEAPPYLYLGETYTETNRPQEAIEALQKYLRLVQPEQNVMREISRAYYLLGRELLRLGRVEEAKKALAESQRYQETKFQYDVKHIFDEKPDVSGGESRTSDRVEGSLQAAAPEGKQGVQVLVKEGLPSAAMARPPTEAPEARDYRAFVAGILASSYNDLGVMRAKNSNFSGAAEYFKQAAAWKPDLPGLDRNWGFAAYRAALYSEATAPLQRELAAHPEDRFIRQLLGLSYFADNDFSKTVEVLRPFAGNPPDDPGLLYAWGTALVRTHDPTSAAAIFRLLLEQNGNDPQVHLLLGRAYAQQQDYANALLEFQKAASLDAHLPEAHYYSGLVYLLQGELDSAKKEFRAELGINPGEPLATYHLGYVLLSEGRAQEAVSLFHEVLKANPSYEPALFELGRALLQTGDIPGAIKSLEAAKSLQPDRDATWYQLSQAYRRAGRTADAASALATYEKQIEASRQKKRQYLETEKP